MASSRRGMPNWPCDGGATPWAVVSFVPRSDRGVCVVEIDAGFCTVSVNSQSFSGGSVVHGEEGQQVWCHCSVILPFKVSRGVSEQLTTTYCFAGRVLWDL